MFDTVHMEFSYLVRLLLHFPVENLLKRFITYILKSDTQVVLQVTSKKNGKQDKNL